jgi:uncharacterized protein (DUF952 family)
MLIYKIADAAPWAAAVASGAFAGSADDLRDGFIHLSTAVQARETAGKHFSGRAGLVLAAVDADKLGSVLKWETSRGGALFPHIYGVLPMSAVAWTKPLALGPDGYHMFPDEVV